jgi:hypothetical protein
MARRPFRPHLLNGSIAALLVTNVVLAACGPLVPTPMIPTDPSPETPKQPLMAAFDRNLAKWQGSGITRYAFTWAPQCFCDTRTHLVVAEGDEIRIDGVRPAAGGSVPLGVPGLFDLVRRAILGDRATIGYDDATGVPISMDSDPIANAVDDELSFSVTDWTLDPPDDALLGRVTAARRTWSSAQVASYAMTVRVTCDCAFDAHAYAVTVQDGETTVRESGHRIDTTQREGVPFTVDSLFEWAAGQAPNGRTTIAFDRDLGYPTRIAVGPDPSAPGQQETIEVSDFRRL